MVTHPGHVGVEVNTKGGLREGVQHPTATRVYMPARVCLCARNSEGGYGLCPSGKEKKCTQKTGCRCDLARFSVVGASDLLSRRSSLLPLPTHKQACMGDSLLPFPCLPGCTSPLLLCSTRTYLSLALCSSAYIQAMSFPFHGRAWLLHSDTHLFSVCLCLRICVCGRGLGRACHCLLWCAPFICISVSTFCIRAPFINFSSTSPDVSCRSARAYAERQYVNTLFGVCLFAAPIPSRTSLRPTQHRPKA